MINSTIKNFNGVSAYGLKPNEVKDIRTMNGTYAPSVFDTTDIALYLDPADTYTYPGTGTTFSSSLGTTNTGTFYGGMESGYDSKGWFETDAVNDYARLPSYSLGTQWTMLQWNYASRLTNANVYLISYDNGGGTGNNNGMRFDIGSVSTSQWARFVFYRNGGTNVYFTNTQPQGYWYLQYAYMNSGVATGYGCSEVAGTFDHRTIAALTVTSQTIRSWNGNVWGSTPSFTTYEVGKTGQTWVFNRVLSTTEIEQIYENTKKRYGY